MEHPGQAPLPGAEPAVPRYERDHTGLRRAAKLSLGSRSLIGALGAAQLFPGKFTNQEH